MWAETAAQNPKTTWCLAAAWDTLASACLRKCCMHVCMHMYMCPRCLSSFLRPQELPLPDGVVVSGTVLQGHVLAAPLHAAIASAAAECGGRDPTGRPSKEVVAAVDGCFSSPRGVRERNARHQSKDAAFKCKDDSGGMHPSSPLDGEQRAPRYAAAARGRLVPSAGESRLGSARDALPPPPPHQLSLIHI